MKNNKLLRSLILVLALVFVLGSWFLHGDENDFEPVVVASINAQRITSSPDDGALPDNTDDAAAPDAALPALNEHGTYDSKDDVALFILTYGRLPDNYITKAEAEKAGWSGGSVEKYCPGKCIGGGRFGNYEGLLPEADGREWTECDINTLSASSRGAERLVFSNDGLIYYTPDHYSSFELLYGEP